MASRWARTLLVVVGVLIALAVVVGLLGVQTARRSFPQTDGTLQVPGLEHPVEVFRDAMGVPSIYAQTMHDLIMGQGFVQAQDRFFDLHPLQAQIRENLVYVHLTAPPQHD